MMDGWITGRREERHRERERKRNRIHNIIVVISPASSVQSLVGEEFRKVNISMDQKSGHSLAQLSGVLKAFQG